MTTCKELIRQLAVKELEAIEKESGTKLPPGSRNRQIWYRLIARYHDDKKTFPFEIDERIYKILFPDDEVDNDF